MQTVILAGGKGRRLMPYTTVFPKPLMPIGEIPIIEVLIRQLKKSGFDTIKLAVGHLAGLMQAYIGDGSKFGVNVEYYMEHDPRGTAGAVKAIQGLDETFLVMNGDILTDLPYEVFMEYHQAQNAMLTIAVFTRDVAIDFGVIETKAGFVEEYIEKPVKKYTVSMGIYAFQKNILDFIKHDQYMDFPDLVQGLLSEKIAVSVYPFDGYWLDIGRPDDYSKAVEDFVAMKHIFLPGSDL